MVGLRIKRLAVLAGMSAFFAVAPARAEVLTFNIHWQGFGFDAPSADGKITVDMAVISPLGVNLPSTLVKSFDLSIRGTGSADGSYTLADFTSLVFDVPTTLDFRSQLCGQAVTMDSNMCDSRGPGSFFMTTQSYLPFSGNGATSLVYGSGDEMIITSFAALPVPEPETFTMLLAGLGLLGWRARRRQ